MMNFIDEVEQTSLKLSNFSYIILAQCGLVLTWRNISPISEGRELSKDFHAHVAAVEKVSLHWVSIEA